MKHAVERVETELSIAAKTRYAARNEKHTRYDIYDVIFIHKLYLGCSNCSCRTLLCLQQLQLPIASSTSLQMGVATSHPVPTGCNELLPAPDVDRPCMQLQSLFDLLAKMFDEIPSSLVSSDLHSSTALIHHSRGTIADP
jgi:hypothetical protein